MENLKLASTLDELQQKPRGLPPNAMLEQTEPTHEQIYYPMGEALLFQTNDPVLLAAADEAFARFLPLSGERQAPPLVLRLFVHDVAGERPSEGERPRPIYRTQGHMFYITIGAGSATVADLLHGYAFGFVTPELAHDRASVRYILLEGLTFAMLGPVRKFVPVHAACVVEGGTSIVLQGKAGRGKSTLAFACVRRGYRVLAEDGLLIRCRPEGARLWGVPWKLHLLPDSRRFFPELAHEQPRLQINGEWKLEIEPETFYPGSTTTNAAPGIVLFLERGEQRGPTRIEPVPLAQAQQEFEVIWPWWVGWTQEMEHQVARLLEGGTYRLWMNGSPDEAVDALDTLLAQIKREAA